MSSKEIADKLRELQSLIGEDTAIHPTIAELWESWAKGMSLMKSEATVASIKSAWKHLEPLIGHRHLQEITGEFWVNEIIPAIRSKTHPEFRFFNCKKWISMFFKWCDENQKAPTGWRRPRLIDPDPETKVGKAYSVEETDALILHADWFLRPKIILALELFMRRSEIALLSKDRVDREKRIIYLRAEDCKTRHARSFPFNDAVEEQFKILDEHLGHLNSPWVFPSPNDPSKSIGRDGFSTAWATCKRKAKVIGRFHELRHTALTRAFRGGGNSALICAMAGLNIDVAQRIYLHFSVDDLREVLEKK